MRRCNPQYEVLPASAEREPVAWTGSRFSETSPAPVGSIGTRRKKDQIPDGQEKDAAGPCGPGDTSRLWTNLLECVKTRQRPYSPIDIAVRVQAPLNMAILSHRESKVCRFDKAKQQIVM